MSFKLASALLGGSAAAAVAALGMFSSTPAQAQPYDSYDNGPPMADTGTYADTAYLGNGITVTAPARRERGPNGAPIEIIRASRTVPIDDLDLSTGRGMDILHSRVERAAYSACDELDKSYVYGRYPVGDSSDSDCMARAVDDAMAQVSSPGY